VGTLVDTLKKQGVVLEYVPSAQAPAIQLFQKRMSRK
jgi:aryl carrier-like protein